ncbi:nucleotidyltransferase family protein [Rhizorhapis sp. SPR117]|uniref:nucleotidyltransferase family protein n=1 Tax=Rhizorhapis sp. SPR117 TaxID=2912611 RepID=UPI001F2AD76C|nr:NTP transferase domain-containing protein [Rhizorhapis sp. SPR117]
MDQHQTQQADVTAMILAGSRPGPDILAQANDVPAKALIRMQGASMLSRVAHMLASHPRIGRVLVLAQDTGTLSRDKDSEWMQAYPNISFVSSGGGISRSIATTLENGEAAYPVLVTTADNVLIDHGMIDSFLDGADGADLAVAMVERRVLHARYPQSRRTWLKFRGGWWSGANLFWLASDQVRPLLNLWQGVEQDRKKGMKIVGAFGPLLLLGALLRFITIHQAIARAGRRFGIKARIIAMPQAEACIDVDKLADKQLAESILAERT